MYVLRMHNGSTFYVNDEQGEEIREMLVGERGWAAYWTVEVAAETDVSVGFSTARRNAQEALDAHNVHLAILALGQISSAIQIQTAKAPTAG